MIGGSDMVSPNRWWDHTKVNVAAAALNATGLSLGYLYVGAFRRGLAALAATVIVIGGLVTLVVPRAPVIALLIVVLWSVSLAIDGWRLGCYRGPVDVRLASRYAPVPQVAVAAAVIAAVVIGSAEYVDARERILAAGRDLHRSGDCAAALREYARLQGGFQVDTWRSETARQLGEDCTLYLDALRLEGANRPEEALQRLTEHAGRHGDSPLAVQVRPDAERRVATAWVRQLLAAGRHGEGASTCDRYRMLVIDNPDGRFACGQLHLQHDLAGLVADSATPSDWGMLSAHASSIPTQWPNSIGFEDVADAIAAGYEAQLSERQTAGRYCAALPWVDTLASQDGPGADAAAHAAEDLRLWTMFGCVQALTDEGKDAKAAAMVADLKLRFPGSMIADAAELYVSHALQEINSGAGWTFIGALLTVPVCALGLANPGTAGPAAACIEVALGTAGTAAGIERLTAAALLTLRCLPEIEVGVCAAEEAVQSLLESGRAMPKRPARTRQQSDDVPRTGRPPR